jgi:hypothetical protein
MAEKLLLFGRGSGCWSSTAGTNQLNFIRLADGLGEAGVASLQFDQRGHGDSEGRQEELMLATSLN